MKTAPKILVATDFSESSPEVLRLACEVAKVRRATVVLVHVLSVPSSDKGEGMLHDGLGREDPAALERRLRATQPCSEGIEVEHRLLRGDPAAEILKLAEAEDVALIVMGTHGRTGLSRLLLGSVAEQVVRHARCPAMMLKVPRGPAS